MPHLLFLHMRQLDLFASIFETTNQEPSPGEQSPPAEKEAEKPHVTEAVNRPFSKNVLRTSKSPAAAETVFEVTGETSPAELPGQSSSLPAPSPLLLSLFDQPIEPANVTSTVEEAPDNRETQSAEAPIDYAEAIAAIAETALEVEEPQPVIDPSSPAILVRKKATAPKQKKQKVPELERSGPIIFDDGKIAVKIKNKSPFPPPLTKVKKEKIKKEPQKRGRKSFKEIDAEIDLVEVPDDEILFQKQYYPISEVAKWFRVNTSLLRFWENEFDVLKPRKNRKGDRLFRPEDVKNLQIIYQLLRQRKYTIEGAKEYIKTNKKKADIQLQLTNTLQKFKSFLLDLKANLQS